MGQFNIVIMMDAVATRDHDTSAFCHHRRVHQDGDRLGKPIVSVVFKQFHCVRNRIILCRLSHLVFPLVM
jgi:hypothetical protein